MFKELADNQRMSGKNCIGTDKLLKYGVVETEPSMIACFHFYKNGKFFDQLSISDIDDFEKKIKRMLGIKKKVKKNSDSD